MRNPRFISFFDGVRGTKIDKVYTFIAYDLLDLWIIIFCSETFEKNKEVMIVNVEITVFTPTYNRAYIINRLYESLQRQEIHNFEWLVVDDGSVDETEELFRTW